MRWRRRKEEAAGAELKTKTPHKDVGKKTSPTVVPYPAKSNKHMDMEQTMPSIVANEKDI